MIGNLLISIGNLFFAILLLLVYTLKLKKIKIDNKLYKSALFLVIIIIITELIAISVIYYYPENLQLIEYWGKVNALFTVLWLMVICLYIMTLGSMYEIKSFRQILKIDNIKFIIFFFVIMLLISSFLDFNIISTQKGNALGGSAFQFLFIASALCLAISVIIAYKDENNIIRYHNKTIIIGMLVAAIVMILQIIFPTTLIIATALVFELYIMYFTFENPDLYLIKELEIAKKKADDSNSAKTDFLSNMSHEIRTPMNAILGFSEGILNEEKFNEQLVRKDIAHIYSAGTNLLEIINNILDISKIETGEEKVESKEYSIGSIVLELKSIIESRISTSKIKFITNIDPNIPAKLIGDKTKVFQILLNLLSNAVKYTEVGRITLNIKSEIINNKAVLNFKISDTGFGIKKEDYDKIFEKFSRLDSATEKEIEGTGLGLVITKKLVNLMNGNIWFESEYGAGTNFYIELSQKIADKKPIGNILIEKNSEDQYDYIDCTGYKVLLVDDNKLNLLVAEKILSPYNFTITKIDNGKDCVNNIKEGNEYDIIFLDHMMPNMDGIEVLHILHKLEGYNIPPIIALTANAITGTKQMYLNEGFDEYLPKPINIGDLDKLIRKYFEKKVSTKANKKKKSTKQESTEYDTIILKENNVDVEGALSFVGSIKNYNDMLKEFYKEVDDKIKQLGEFLNNNDMKNYSVLVHSLKSDCKFLGINDFADQAYEHEKESKKSNIDYIKNHYNDLIISKENIKKTIKKYFNL